MSNLSDIITGGGGGGGITTETYSGVIPLSNSRPTADSGLPAPMDGSGYAVEPSQATITLIKQGRVVTATLNFYFEVDPDTLDTISAIGIDEMSNIVPVAFQPSITQTVFTRIFSFDNVGGTGSESLAKLTIGNGADPSAVGLFLLSFADGGSFDKIGNGDFYGGPSPDTEAQILSSAGTATFSYIVD